jgi:hypothetical protein
VDADRQVRFELPFLIFPAKTFWTMFCFTSKSCCLVQVHKLLFSLLDCGLLGGHTAQWASILKTNAKGGSKTSVIIYRTIRCHNQNFSIQIYTIMNFSNLLSLLSIYLYTQQDSLWFNLAMTYRYAQGVHCAGLSDFSVHGPERPHFSRQVAPLFRGKFPR